MRLAERTDIIVLKYFQMSHLITSKINIKSSAFGIGMLVLNDLNVFQDPCS